MREGGMLSREEEQMMYLAGKLLLRLLLGLLVVPCLSTHKRLLVGESHLRGARRWDKRVSDAMIRVAACCERLSTPSLTVYKDHEAFARRTKYAAATRTHHPENPPPTYRSQTNIEPLQEIWTHDHKK